MGQRDGLCLHSLHCGIFGVLSDYVALRKSSNNWKQHLFLEQWWIIGNMMLM